MRQSAEIRILLICALASSLTLFGCGDSSVSGGPAGAAPTPTPSETTGKGSLLVLSNRADLISGGDALVEFVLPTGADAKAVTMTLDGRDVTGSFALRANGRYMGLVTGLRDGANTLVARLPGGADQQLVITNHPNGGPVFSGPQIQPWPCLAGATDAQCNRPVTYEFIYKRTSGGALAAYNPASPATDVAMTTTDQGKTVPFIVRVESGAQDRGQYSIAVLFDPTKEWQPWAPQAGWNGKTANHGGSGCGTRRGEAESDGEFLAEDELALGFLSWETSLSHNNRNCNLVVQAESLMMAKERIVEAYGPIRYTIGEGGSGGSIKQQQAANAYPGIYDGIIPTQSFVDTWSTATGEVLDCRYLVDFFATPAGLMWSPLSQAAVMGHPTVSICQSWINVFAFDWALAPRSEEFSADPVHQRVNTQGCNVPMAQVWNPQTNPTGVRCSLADYMVNILGRNPQDGYANRPHDNTGVQYGLKTLMAATITPAQFVDLNARIGSRDVNYDIVPTRAVGDTATMAIAYRSGLFNQGDHMHLPIIDQRGNDNEEIHHNYHSYEMRARLDRSNGHHDNQVIWNTGPVANGNQKASPSAFLLMDKWLGAIEADTSDTPFAQKVVKNKPAAAHDLCTDGNGNELPPATCAQTRLVYSEPRSIAGEPAWSDVTKCTLKPLAKADYAPIQFTDAQWTQMQATFPTGVCDYSGPAVGRTPTVAWLTYSEGPVGKPLPAMAPPAGWASPSMRHQ